MKAATDKLKEHVPRKAFSVVQVERCQLARGHDVSQVLTKNVDITFKWLICHAVQQAYLVILSALYSTVRHKGMKENVIVKFCHSFDANVRSIFIMFRKQTDLHMADCRIAMNGS